ncbi:hypothetical protein ACFVP3_39720 [Streptomyces sp. NPDC057806]|uniref:hypothetical protein n=1 Tax=Streptomyces sp. NPDC057806 TaxID=3346255 RepID=UPI0036A4F359
MLDQALTALAAAGGIAVVQAAGTDAWVTFRERVARLFGRSDERQTAATLQRLDRTATELQQAGPDVEPTRARLAGSWQGRFEDLLEGLGETDRVETAEQLRTVVGLVGRQVNGDVTAHDGGLAAGGDINIRADRGAVAGGVIREVHLGTPPRPGAEQG